VLRLVNLVQRLLVGLLWPSAVMLLACTKELTPSGFGGESGSYSLWTLETGSDAAGRAAVDCQGNLPGSDPKQ